MKSGLDKPAAFVLPSDMRNLPAAPHRGAIRRNTSCGV